MVKHMVKFVVKHMFTRQALGHLPAFCNLILHCGGGGGPGPAALLTDELRGVFRCMWLDSTPV
jgi:hypothetical protein